MVAFFVVVVPGHRRGLVSLPGHSAADSGTGFAVTMPYCPLCVLVDRGGPGGAPPADAPVNCALCFLKTNLDTPPALDLPPVFAERLDYLLFAPRRVAAVTCATQYRLCGRAPPSAA